MKIGVATKSHRSDFAPQLKEVLRWLRQHECDIVVDAEAVREFGLEGETAVERELLPEQAEVIIVFGGDGTLLSVARLIRDRKAAILGVNLGSLGFLTEITLEEVYEALESLLAGHYSIDRRQMLHVEVPGGAGKPSTYQALNDAVVSNKGELARIISMQAFVNQELIANYLADGIIVSTPTGSTAYSLSAGGPIVYPTLDAMLITPICPHTLTHRPLVIPGDSQIRILIRSSEEVMLTIDGQQGVELAQGDEIRCTRSRYQVKLIQPRNKGFFDVLREKLKWGER